ncbi:MAG: hypothetical protein AAB336_05495 [Acidobacteriota bacterium]
MTVFAQKTIENKTVEPNVRDENFRVDWVVDLPKAEISEYLNSMKANQEIKRSGEKKYEKENIFSHFRTNFSYH